MRSPEITALFEVIPAVPGMMIERYSMALVQPSAGQLPGYDRAI